MRFLASIFLSTTLLLSTMGLSVWKHYCGGELAHAQVVTTHTPEKHCEADQKKQHCQNCEDQEKTPGHCEKEEQPAQHKGNCCNNEVETLKVADPFLAVSHAFQVNLTPTLIALKPYRASLSGTAFNTTPHNYRNSLSHALPAVTHGIRVFVQSFQL
jgi:hypothetical protein